MFQIQDAYYDISHIYIETSYRKKHYMCVRLVVKSLFGLYLIIAEIMLVCNQKDNSYTPNYITDMLKTS